VSKLRYFKSSVQIEPLVGRWYAWSHLIAPAPSALNVVRRHLPIMESYIAEPSVHAEAVADPSLLGGPFLDYGGERVDDIKALFNWTRERCTQQIELARAVVSLNELLRRYGDGGPLEFLYARVPSVLKGLVELVYDTNHYPSVRFLEPLMYRSELYDETLQSLAFAPTQKDERKFVMSTPRLDDGQTIFSETPFRSPLIDRLFAMRTIAGDIDGIAGMFSKGRSIDTALREYFTEVTPRRPQRYEKNAVRIRYFGHACVLIEAGGTSVLIDPVVSYEYATDLPRFTYLDLPEAIDYVLLTHNHQDHVMIETLLQIRHRVGKIIVPSSGSGTLQDPSLRLMLNTIGFENIEAVDMLQEVDIPGGSILAVPFLGEHCDLRIDSKTGYVVSLGGHRIFLGADSRNIEPSIYERIASLLDGVDTVFIGMECDGAPLSWLYGPLLTQPLSRDKDSSRTLSGSDSKMVARMLDLFKPERIFIYAMGQEPWLNHVMCLRYTETSEPIVESNKILNECRELGLQAERLFGSREIILN
jgi:L-ascorbate metabolism protein UlaG (beta-lactamase superfamily)